MNVIAYGAHAVLVECGSLAETMAVAAQLTNPRLPGADDVVPSARTVLVRCAGISRPAELVARVHDRLRGWAAAAPTATSVPGVRSGASSSAATTVEIAVCYDGEDLRSVAAAVGMTPEEVVDSHSEASYTVGFCGFAPGFAYLVGLPDALVLARRDTPRPSVPAGSVAIAGEFSAVYPTASPGGWHLLGRTDRQMFDPVRIPPALLVPGTAVRFVPA